jgi:hypothetical protein
VLGNRVLTNRVLTTIFGPNRDKITGGWIKLYNEVHNLNSSPNITRMIKIKEAEMDMACSTNSIEEKFMQSFGSKTRRKDTIRKPRRRWEYIINTNFEKMECEVVDWTHLAQGRDQWLALVKAVMKLRKFLWG